MHLENMQVLFSLYSKDKMKQNTQTHKQKTKPVCTNVFPTSRTLHSYLTQINSSLFDNANGSSFVLVLLVLTSSQTTSIPNLKSFT